LAEGTPKVQDAAAAAGYVAGVFQTSVVIPDDCPPGAVPLSVTVGSILTVAASMRRPLCVKQNLSGFFVEFTSIF